MTTRDKGITLPSWSNLRLTNGSFEVSSSIDFSADASYKYTSAGIAPVTATSASTVASPSSLAIVAQNASPSFTSVGGSVNLTTGVGSIGAASGNVTIKDTAGNGGAWNTAHAVLGTYHLWINSLGKLWIKNGAPTSDTDGAPVNIELAGSAVYDPPSLTTGSGATTTISVAGAALGDFVLVSFSLDLQGIVVSAYVSAANTVAVRFQNQTGGTLDLGSGTLRVRIIKQ